MIKVPGDKSIAHRALILGAVAKGEQIVRGIPDSADVAATIRCLEKLGATIEHTSSGRAVVRPGSFHARAALDAGNSGTTARMLCGLAAGIPAEVRIDGDGSLRRRPMERVAEPLRRMGAAISTSPGGVVPMTITGGGLSGISFCSPVASAQVKTAVLIAGLFAEGRTRFEEPVQTRDHTERLLRAMSADIKTEGLVTIIDPRNRIEAVEVAIPGDVSSASCFIAAAACIAGSSVTLPATGVNPTRTGLISVLLGMGASIDFANETSYLEEPAADIVAEHRKLSATEVSGDAVPSMIDELPLLAVAATQAEGETVVRDAGELRVKESDRIKSVVENLARMGADIAELEDGFAVRGPTRLRGAAVSSFGDHRIAMAMAVAGLLASGPTEIDGSESVEVSYPGFFADIEKLRG